MIKFKYLIGLSGVSSHENDRAKFWDGIFQWPMLMLAVWIPVQWYLDFRTTTHAVDSGLIDWLVWWLFLIELLLLSWLVDDKKRYLQTNWMNVVIVAVGLPIILWGYSPLAATLRSLRLFLMFGLIYRASKAIRIFLSRNQLGTTLLIAFFLVVIAGMMISAIDPAFDSPVDGIWWALVTISTVGYGDYSPVSIPGRIFAGLLILAGVVLLSLITANLAAFFIEKEVEQESEADERHLNQVMAELYKQIEHLDVELQRLHKRLDNWEKEN